MRVIISSMRRYELRVSNQSDLEECERLISDNISTLSTWRLPPTKQNNLFVPKQVLSSEASLSVFDDNICVGNIALFDIDMKCRSCDIAIILKINSDFKLVISSIAKLCFKTLGLNRIQLQTFFDSPLSVLCEGANLHLDAILREHGFEDGAFKDVQIWSLLSKEFDERFSNEL